MTILELFFLAFALGADCFAVCIAIGLVKHNGWSSGMGQAALMGVMQGSMPLGGYYVADAAFGTLAMVHGLVAGGVLVAIGAKMMRDVVSCKSETEELSGAKLSLRMALALSVATSIDALAAGVALGRTAWGQGASLLTALTVIGVVAAAMGVAGFFLGRGLGCRAKRFRMEALAAIVLITLGVKTWLEL